MSDLTAGMKITVTTVLVAETAALAVATSRPDNGWRPHRRDGSLACGTSNRGYVCTADKGHSGDHMAYGSAGRVCDKWRNDDDIDTVEALAGLRAKLAGGGMYGWFESYPDRPMGGTVLCAACADSDEIVDKFREKTYRYPDGWDYVKAIRAVDPTYDRPGYNKTRRWVCSSCSQRGWPDS